MSKRIAALGASGLAVLAAGTYSLMPPQVTASSHREAPLISGQPQYDNTDVYAFVSPDRPDTTTLIANFLPFEEPAGGPNFYTFAKDARYDLNVDADGDSQPEQTFRFTFKNQVKNGNTFLYNTGPVKSLADPALNLTQTYDLELVHRRNGTRYASEYLIRNAPVAPSNVGAASMPDYPTLRNQAIKDLPSGGKVFAGQADDPFFLDLRVFDLLYGTNLKEVGNDTLKNYNVQTVALQIPTKLLIKEGQPIIGVYSSVLRQNAAGEYAPVSRLAMPLVNEVVIPMKDKDRFNASIPWHDAQFGKYVTSPELPKLLEAIYKVKAPAEPRNDLVQVFLTGVPKLNQPPGVRPAELMRLNTSIPPTAAPKRLGVLDGDTAGYPNGRRLTDDVVDISLQAVAGELLGAKNDLGDKVDANDRPFGKTFPYVALPTSGSTTKSAAVGVSGRPDVLDVKPAGASSSTDEGGTPLPAIAALVGGGALLSGGLTWWFRRRIV
ncbi:DUF4331 domain-containing protein [Actinocorallia longicatena]|uniref:DUF4331 domain-containing protein n=1 Tax=Actinocorallia longicatena TaxID=111803 RepID=A0ABP6QIF8_9ACTN